MLSFQFIRMQITREMISSEGARISTRVSSMAVCWSCLTSVVQRVTSDAVENLSTSAKEKVCTFLKIAWRRL